MAISFDSFATVKANVLTAIRGQFPTEGTGPRKFLGKLAAVFTLAIYPFLRTARRIDLDAVPTSSTTEAGLNTWGEAIGVPNGVAGQYGRKGATAATGGVGTFTGVAATVYLAGVTLTASDGVTKFSVVSNVVIPGSGTTTGAINAVTTGTAGNLGADEVLTVDTVPAGGDPTVTLTTALDNGEDQESLSAFLGRILFRFRHGPKAITPPDIKEIAEGIAGVDTAYVYPLRHGAGSADVVITAPVSAGGGAARDPGATIQGLVQDALDDARNVTATVTVYRPQFGAGVTIDVRAVPSDGFEFDYADGGTAATVKAGGTTTLLRINGSPPAALAVNDRIQVMNTTTGAPMLAAQPRVTVIDTVTINPDTILTLETPLAVYPTAADKIYSGGPAVLYVQQAIQNYLDGLGPSRDSGYADPTDSWLDDITISGLIRSSLDAVDASNTRVLAAVVFSATVPQVKIAGAVVDYSPPDVSADGPNLAIASVIVVRA